MTTLVSACLAVATVLFVVSLPLGSTGVGTALRRWAGAIFLLAFAPSLACSVLAASSGRGEGALSLLHVLAGIGVVALASGIAYIALVARGAIRRDAHRQQAGSPDRRGYRYDEAPRGTTWQRRD